MAQPIILSHGCKGGVGKSAVSAAIAEILGTDLGRPVLGIDADHRNPSFAEQLQRCPVVKVERAALVDQDTVIEMFNLIDGHRDVPVIIDLPAGASGQLQIHAKTFEGLLADLGRPVHTLWTISRARSGLASLAVSLPQLVSISTSIAVVRNLHWGRPEQFARFAGSRIRAVMAGEMDRAEVEAAEIPGVTALYDAMQARKIKTGVLDFPDLHDAIFDLIIDGGEGVGAAIDGMSFAHRSLAKSWFREVRAMVEAGRKDGLL